MSILELTGAESCKKCGEKARSERDRLQTENAKLRELVAYMWTYDYAGHFSTLPEHMEHVDAVWQQMQLLGIEVGG